jgi:hypothetical protein
MKGKLSLVLVSCLILIISCSKGDSDKLSSINPNGLDLSGDWEGTIQGTGTSTINCADGLLHQNNETITFNTNGSTISVNGMFPDVLNTSLVGTLSENSLNMPFNNGGYNPVMNWDFVGGSMEFNGNSAFVRCTLQNWTNQNNEICSTIICTGTITRQ